MPLLIRVSRGCSRIAGVHTALAGLAVLAAAAPAQAAGTWTCRASGGWVAQGGERAEPLVAGGAPPCAAARADGAAPAGIAFAKPAAVTSAGASGATTDTQRPVADVSADSVVIQNADGSLRLSARALRARAEASCSSARVPGMTSSSGVRDVTLNGRPIGADGEFSEPGVGVNGAPLFGRLRVRFGVVATDGDAGAATQRLVRRAVHVTVTDSAGVVVFEAAAGEVAVGREGRVCDPPPVCSEGQQLDARANRCVDVDVALPPPPPPAGPLPPAPPGPVPGPDSPRPRAGCSDADALPGTASARELRAATICLVNAQRSRRGLRRLRVNGELELAARRHARDMVVRHYFAHDSPSGSSVLDRILRTRYLRRYGRWRVGEVLGWGWGRQGAPAAIVAAWMRSAEHRRQLLGRYTEMGVGIQRDAPRRLERPATTFVIDLGTYAR